MSSRLQANQRFDYVVDTDALISTTKHTPTNRSKIDDSRVLSYDDDDLDDERSLASRIERVLGARDDNNNDDNTDDADDDRRHKSSEQTRLADNGSGIDASRATDDSE
jgi:hypothetical protein